jgi:hypothetical protein
MSRTNQLDETIDVRRPLREAFACVSEFPRIEEWDPALPVHEKAALMLRSLLEA